VYLLIGDDQSGFSVRSIGCGAWPFSGIIPVKVGMQYSAALWRLPDLRRDDALTCFDSILAEFAIG
jgi:hypothetical protein